jgi:hypothetical protein
MKLWIGNTEAVTAYFTELSWSAPVSRGNWRKPRVTGAGWDSDRLHNVWKSNFELLFKSKFRTLCHRNWQSHLTVRGASFSFPRPSVREWLRLEINIFFVFQGQKHILVQYSAYLIYRDISSPLFETTHLNTVIACRSRLHIRNTFTNSIP